MAADVQGHTEEELAEDNMWGIHYDALDNAENGYQDTSKASLAHWYDRGHLANKDYTFLCYCSTGDAE
jgi:hypothetical protein